MPISNPIDLSALSGMKWRDCDNCILVFTSNVIPCTNRMLIKFVLFDGVSVLPSVVDIVWKLFFEYCKPIPQYGLILQQPESGWKRMVAGIVQQEFILRAELFADLNVADGLPGKFLFKPISAIKCWPSDLRANIPVDPVTVLLFSKSDCPAFKPIVRELLSGLAFTLFLADEA